MSLRYAAGVRMRITLTAVVGLASPTRPVFASEPEPAHRREADVMSARHWVFFADRGRDEVRLSADLDHRRAELDPRAHARRVRVRGDIGYDARDLAPAPHYVERLEAEGARVRHVSRWLNAVSI